MRRRTVAGQSGRLTRFAIACFAILAAACLCLAPDGAAIGQDDDLPKEDAKAEGDGPAPEAGKDEGEKAPGADAPKPDGQGENLLSFTFKSLGWRYTIPFLFLSFTFVALVVMNFMSVRRESIVPMQLVESFEANLNEQKFQDAYNLAKQDESFLGKVLSAGLEKVKFGYPQAIEAMQEVGEDETMKLEHRLSYIALIGVISPMVGLLGTVDGMVGAFQELASKSTQPSPQVLAEKIGTALVTTLVGLLLAIPAVAFFTFFKNRLARFTLEVGIMSEQLMSRFSSVGAKKS